ncbi:MAG TPA: hypothetical protein VF913_05445 [Xanthobacteraceae bacterium]
MAKAAALYLVRALDGRVLHKDLSLNAAALLIERTPRWIQQATARTGKARVHDDAGYLTVIRETVRPERFITKEGELDALADQLEGSLPKRRA